VRCALPVASLRAEPSDEAEQVTQALQLEPLQVLERRGAWAKVETAYYYAGWMHALALEPGKGELPAAEGTDPVELARELLGAPYEWGGLTAAGIDCSGLVHLAYRRIGRLIPRDSWQQEAAGTPVAPGEERPGDLITYGEAEKTDHIAFWTGPGTILHATARDGLGVVEEPEPPELAARRRAVVRL
jgi:cell wall-associated NlpC family hydrolase